MEYGMTIRGGRDPLPYYPWFVKDFRANRKVQRMNYIERGLYRELLDECWEEGVIPDDPLKLAEICNCPPGVMVEAWPKIRPCFTATEGLDGMLLQNDKLESLRNVSEEKRNQQRLAGLASAEKRRQGERTLNGRQRALNGRQPAEHIRTEQNKAVRSTEQDGPAAVNILGILSAGPCAWCGAAKGEDHLPTCKPERVPGPQDG